MEQLKNNIVTLNTKKNSFVIQKLNGESPDKGDLVSCLIYLIADCRKIGENINSTPIVRKDEKDIFIQLNKNVMLLKNEIMYIVETPVEELKKVINQNKKKIKTKETDDEKRVNKLKENLKINKANK